MEPCTYFIFLLNFIIFAVQDGSDDVLRTERQPIDFKLHGLPLLEVVDERILLLPLHKERGHVEGVRRLVVFQLS